MNRLIRMASVAALVGITSLGCGEVPDEITSTQSALGSFGTWKTMTGKSFLDTPALANGSTLTAYGWDGSQIWVSNQNASGQWTGNWTQLSNPGGAFNTRASAAAFDVPPGTSLFGRFAIVARRSDTKYYLTIRDQTGTIVDQQWTAVGTGLFKSAPSLIMIPTTSRNAPVGTLVLAGQGTDDRVWIATNTLTRGPGGNYIYNHANWTGFNFHPEVTRFFDNPPAMTFACPVNTAQPTMYIGSKDAVGRFFTTKFNGSSWSNWTEVHNGLFAAGPALATGCGDSFNETVIYGRGTDSNIYWSTEPQGGPQVFTPISAPNIFVGAPMAVGQRKFTTHGASNVAALRNTDSIGLSNQALSP